MTRFAIAPDSLAFVGIVLALGIIGLVASYGV